MDFGNLGVSIGGFNPMDPTGDRAYGRQKHERRMSQRFSERMSSTAYQRAAKDLEAAGLNRILALGQPASSPQSSGSQVQQAKGEAKISQLEAAQADLMQATGKKEGALTKQANEAAKGLEADAKIKALDAKIYDKSPMLRKTKLLIDSLGNALPALIGGGAMGLMKGMNKIKNRKPKYQKDSPKHYRGLP